MTELARGQQRPGLAASFEHSVLRACEARRADMLRTLAVPQPMIGVGLFSRSANVLAAGQVSGLRLPKVR